MINLVNIILLISFVSFINNLIYKYLIYLFTAYYFIHQYNQLNTFLFSFILNLQRIILIINHQIIYLIIMLNINLLVFYMNHQNIICNQSYNVEHKLFVIVFLLLIDQQELHQQMFIFIMLLIINIHVILKVIKLINTIATFIMVMVINALIFLLDYLFCFINMKLHFLLHLRFFLLIIHLLLPVLPAPLILLHQIHFPPHFTLQIIQ